MGKVTVTITDNDQGEQGECEIKWELDPPGFDDDSTAKSIGYLVMKYLADLQRNGES